MLALIDADIICYSVGFSTENLDEQEAKRYVDLFIQGVLTETEADSYECWLSDSRENNFRHKLSASYKANRKQDKPKHYNLIKEHLLVAHNGRIAHELEADDMLALRYKENPLNSIICTLDKDLDQVEGWHYRWAIYRDGEVLKPSIKYYVDGESAMKFFWKQMLIGDTADNIKGIDNIGKVKADKIINPLETDEECREVVSEIYLVHSTLRDYHINYELLKIPKEDYENHSSQEEAN